MIYEDEMNYKIASMMKGMNFMPGMGLGKDQQGPAEFIEPKVPISKHGLGFQKVKKVKGAERKVEKKKSLWETFVEEGTNYPYTGKPEPLMIADMLIPRFEIFAAEMNRVSQPIVKREIVEELVLNEGPEEAIPTAE